MRRRGRISLLILLFERRDGCFWWIFALHLRDHCAIYTEKKCVPKHVYKKQRERERRLMKAAWKYANACNVPWGHRGLYELRPRHILLFLVSGGGENSFDAYKARLKSESTKKKEKKKRKISRRSCLLNSAIQLDHFFSFFVQVEERRDYRQRGRKGGRLFRHFAFSEWCCSSRGIKVAMTGCLNAGLELLISWMIMGEVSRLCTVCLVYRLLLQDGN